ncbi:hypothetical protein, partial [Limosilactobacillus fermentum]|uniref:hypothetical protein n=1 Tax=Limosilactobacillus fermentum TaxID=1613 RepID=UPI001D15B242
KEMTKPWRNITTIWSDKKNCIFVFISVNLTGDSTNQSVIGSVATIEGSRRQQTRKLDARLRRGHNNRSYNYTCSITRPGAGDAPHYQIAGK